MKKASPKQIKRIHTVGGILGMKSRDSPDELHLLVRALTGKKSTKDLENDEANRVIAELDRLLGSVPQRSKAHPEHPGGPTEGQQRKAWALMYRLEELDHEPSQAELVDRLRGIIKKVTGISAGKEDPFAWLSREGTSKVIYTIQQYIKTAEKKVGAANGLHRQDHAERS